MYEEEFVVTVQNKKDGSCLVYKYFSDLTNDGTIIDSAPDATNTIERGNLLGSTLVAHAPWTAKD